MKSLRRSKHTNQIMSQWQPQPSHNSFCNWSCVMVTLQTKRNWCVFSLFPVKARRILELLKHTPAGQSNKTTCISTPTVWAIYVNKSHCYALLVICVHYHFWIFYVVLLLNALSILEHFIFFVTSKICRKEITLHASPLIINESYFYTTVFTV